MTDLQIRPWLVARAHAQLRAYGHSVTSIRWDADGQEGSGTCTHCGDGVLLYYDPQPDRCSIEGTAIATLWTYLHVPLTLQEQAAAAMDALLETGHKQGTDDTDVTGTDGKNRTKS